MSMFYLDPDVANRHERVKFDSVFLIENDNKLITIPLSPSNRSVSTVNCPLKKGTLIEGSRRILETIE